MIRLRYRITRHLLVEGQFNPPVELRSGDLWQGEVRISINPDGTTSENGMYERLRPRWRARRNRA